MKIGKQGLSLIKLFEGLELKAYMPTPNDRPTIGYGHTKGVKMGMKISRERADALLVEDLAWVEAVIAKKVTVSLTQPQYDALCSFIYNVGAGAFSKSTLLRRLNEGNYMAAANQLLRWNKQKKMVLSGLTRRRAAEKALFLSEPLAPTKVAKKPTGGLLEALMTFFVSITKGRG